jgi:hypothetical protein
MAETHHKVKSSFTLIQPLQSECAFPKDCSPLANAGVEGTL